MKSRWSSNVCCAAWQAVSKMKSVKDLWLASAALLNTFSCSGVALNPNREDRALRGILDLSEPGFVGMDAFLTERVQRIIYVLL